MTNMHMCKPQLYHVTERLHQPSMLPSAFPVSSQHLPPAGPPSRLQRNRCCGLPSLLSLWISFADQCHRIAVKAGVLLCVWLLLSLLSVCFTHSCLWQWFVLLFLSSISLHIYKITSIYKICLSILLLGCLGYPGSFFQCLFYFFTETGLTDNVV